MSKQFAQKSALNTYGQRQIDQKVTIWIECRLPVIKEIIWCLIYDFSI